MNAFLGMARKKRLSAQALKQFGKQNAGVIAGKHNEGCVMKNIMNKVGAIFPTGSRSQSLRAAVMGAGIGLLVAAPSASAWNYSNTPLFWAAGAQPNTMLVMDDSGSMLYMTYSKSYSEYLSTYASTANAYQPPLSNPTVPSNDDASDPYDTVWYFCTGLVSTNLGRCSGTSPMPDVLAVQSPRTVDTSKKGHNYIYEWYRSELSNVFRGSSSWPVSAVTCDVTKYTGSKFTLATTSTASANIGVLVSNKSGTAQTGAINACVRLKEASTAVSPRIPSGGNCVNTGTLSTPETTVPPVCKNSLDAYTWYEPPYLHYLLTRNVTASGIYNMANTYGAPPTDTLTASTAYPDAPTASITAENDPRIIPSLNRIEAARQSAKKVVNENFANIRIGYTRFWDNSSGASGGDIKNTGAEIGVSQSSLLQKIDNTRALGGTPLIAATYETYRYFAGLSPQYTPNGSTNFSSPIQYRCQKNFVVALTDGEPSTGDVGNSSSCNDDNYTPSKIGDLTGWPSGSLNYDGQPDACVTTVSGPRYDPYLDDFSQWAYNTDMKTATSSAPTTCYGGEPVPASAGKDCTGKSWNDTAFPKQNVSTYTVGFGLKNNMLVETPETNPSYTVTGINTTNEILTIGSHALSTGDKIMYRKADVASGTPIGGLVDGTEYYVVRQSATEIKLALTNTAALAGTPVVNLTSTGSGSHVISSGPAQFYLALTADDLAAKLGNAFSQINKIVSTASAVATNSTRLNGDTRVYQARFNTEDWSGNVQAFKVSTSDGEVNTGTPDWEAKDTVKAGTRGTMLTWNGTAGANFEWGSLTAAQQAALNNDTNAVTWIRGTDMAGYRERKNGIIGDIINSDPAFVGALNFGYMNLPDTCTSSDGGITYDNPSGCSGGKLYAKFVEDNKSRQGMIYFGANDGQLHGVTADTGAEKVAFIPNGVYTVNGENKLYNLTQPDYSHRYFVDGSPFVGDAYIGNSWKTVLVGGLGVGGKSVYALNVTDSTFTTSDVMWEVTDPELGFTLTKPVVARMQDGNWYAIFGNGPDSTSDQARLFLVNLASGAKTIISTNVGSATSENGMTAVGVRLDSGRMVTAVYGGDLQGNIWNFDVNDKNKAKWGLSHKVFQAKDSSGNPQPITGGIRLGSNPKVPTATMVFFGTGKYFETTDSSYDSTPVHDTFYGILDEGSEVSKGSLVKQEMSSAGTMDGVNYRSVTTKDVNFTGSDNGWYLDLVLGSKYEGERVVSTPTLHGGRIIFVTLVPESADRCIGGGSSWLYEIDALTGGNLGEAVFDTNGDGKIDDNDAKVAGLQSEAGIMSEPAIIKAGDDIEYKLLGSTSSSKPIITVMEDEPAGDEGGSAGAGRMSWQQLQ